MAIAKLTVARILSPLARRPDRGLGTALVPGLPVERFNRTWRLEADRSQLATLRGAQSRRAVREAIGPTLRGRLGFDKTTGEAPAWDDSQERFVVQRQHDGDVVPFVIRLSDLAVAFQRTSKIKRQSFIGALQKLLREGAQDDDWKVRDRLTQRAWEDFRSEVTVVTEVRLVVRPTNPNWAGQELFEPYIEEVRGDSATITVKGENLDLDSRPVEQARRHAIENGYGELTVKGHNEDGAPMMFDSEDAVPLLDVTVDRRTGTQVSHEVLERALSQADDLAAEDEADEDIEGE